MNKALRTRSESHLAPAAALNARFAAGPQALHGAPSLACRIAAGDREAETELVLRFSGTALRLLQNHGFDLPTSRDLLQDTLLQALVTLRSGGPLSDEDTFRLLLGTAHFLAKNAQRKELRQQAQRVMDAQLQTTVDAEPDPEETLDRHRRIQAAQAAVSRLVALRDRELLARHFLQGDSREQLQHEFGWTPVQFNKLLSRALSRLRAMMTDHSQTDPHVPR